MSPTPHKLDKPSDIMDHELEEMLAPLRLAVKEQVSLTTVEMMQLSLAPYVFDVLFR